MTAHDERRQSWEADLRAAGYDDFSNVCHAEAVNGRRDAVLDQCRMTRPEAFRQLGTLKTDGGSSVEFVAVGVPFNKERRKEALRGCYQEYGGGVTFGPFGGGTLAIDLAVQTQDGEDAGTWGIDNDREVSNSSAVLVFWPLRRDLAFELTPPAPGATVEPLRSILDEFVPTIQGHARDRAATCELPGSVSILGGGSRDCDGHAVGHVIDWLRERRVILVWRACATCLAWVATSKEKARPIELGYVDHREYERHLAEKARTHLSYDSFISEQVEKQIQQQRHIDLEVLRRDAEECDPEAEPHDDDYDPYDD